METREQLLKKKYGFNKAGYKYIPAGSEILKYVGQIVIHLEFKKKEDDQERWDNPIINKAQIVSISDFDPMTMTYLCKYKLAGDPTDTDPREIRIVPEGFSWGNPEETGHMERFIPYSMHCTLVEDEAFYERLAEFWEKRDTIPVSSLLNLSRSKEKEATLKYSHNIGALIKLTSTNEFLWTRIINLNLIHKVGDRYSLKFGNKEDSWQMMINSSDKEYDFESGIGLVKLIDLSD